MVHGLHHGAAIGGGQRVNQGKDEAAVHAAEHLAHARFGNLAAAEGDGLVGQAEGVAHGAARGARQQAQGGGFGGHVFLRQHALQVRQHGFGGHGPQVELQAARKNRDGHFLRVGGGEHEFQVFGRLFQRFEHGVECRVAEHVHFVNHEDLEAPLHGLVDGLLQQALDFVHAPVAGGVQLGVVHKAPGVDGCAGRALAARGGGDAALPVRPRAVERLGQDARNRGFAHAARAGEQIGVVQALLRERIAQGLHHVLLAHHF